MSDFACNNPADCATKNEGPQALEAPTVPYHRDPDEEDRTMACNSQHIGHESAQNQAKSENWQSIGDLVSTLVRRAGAQ